MIQFICDDPTGPDPSQLAEVDDHQSQFGSIPFIINTDNLLGTHEDRPFLDQLQHTFFTG